MARSTGPLEPPRGTTKLSQKEFEMALANMPNSTTEGLPTSDKKMLKVFEDATENEKKRILGLLHIDPYKHISWTSIRSKLMGLLPTVKFKAEPLKTGTNKLVIQTPTGSGRSR